MRGLRVPGLCLSAALVAASLLFASPYSMGTNHAQEPDTSANVSIVLAIDNSGSMEESNPSGERFLAAELFARLLDPGDRVSVVTFGDTAETALDWHTISSVAETESAANALTPQGPAGDTNMNAAFAKAAELLTADDSGNQQFLVLLTDGRPEVEGFRPGDAGFDQWWSEALSLVDRLTTPVLAIALTKAGETPYLNQVVGLTQGRVFEATDAREIPDAYLQVFGDLKDRTVAIASPRDGGYGVDVGASVRAVHVVTIGADPHAAVSIGGNNLPATTWSEGRYAVSTILPPEGEFVPPGSWIVAAAPGLDARAIELTRIRVNVREPTVALLPAGGEWLLAAQLVEQRNDGRLVKVSPDSLEVEVVRADGTAVKPRLNDDGLQGDARAGDLVYSFRLSDTAVVGQTSLEFIAFRAGVRSVTTKQVTSAPFPELVIQSPNSDDVEVRGGEALAVTSTFRNESESFVDRRVEYQLISDDGTLAASAPGIEGSEYQGALAVTRGGTYELRGVWSGSLDGAPISGTATRTVRLRIQPVVQFVEPDLEFGSSRERTLEVVVYSDGPVGLVALSPDGDDKFDFEPATVEPGRQQVKLLLETSAAGGQHSGTLTVKSDEGVRVEPTTVDYSFKVPSWFERNRLWLLSLVAVLLVVAITFLVWYVRLCRPTGLLVPSGGGTPVSLGARKKLWPKNRLRVGGGRGVDIRVAGLTGSIEFLSTKETISRMVGQVRPRRVRGKTCRVYALGVRSDSAVLVDGSPLLMGSKVAITRGVTRIKIGDAEYTYQ